MGVGGKRFRGVGGRTRSTANAGEAEGSTGASVPVQHEASLVDEVRASVDPEFAAEVRAAKRRRADTAAVEKTRRGYGARKSRHASSKTESRNRERNGDDQDDTSDVDGTDVKDKGASKPLDQRMSDKILAQARKQREELEDEQRGSGDVGWERANSGGLDATAGFGSDNCADDSDDSEDDDHDSGSSDVGGRNMNSDGAGVSQHGRRIFHVEAEDGSNLTHADELALALFGEEGGFSPDGSHPDQDAADADGPDGQGRVMLADIILEKFREKAAKDAAAAAAAADPAAAAREKKIEEIYSLVGSILSKYKSGRVPKAFKIIPKLRNWEDLMYLTRPDEWSPAACFAATRLLASNLESKEVVKFYRSVLLPRVLQDISENKKLNYHLFRALKKAVFKPDAFNKGILFPLCQSGGCSLREATVIGSVISQVSIPMLHSAAALLYIAERPYALSNSVFIHVLLDKKYSLPYRVVDALVVHFCRMKVESRSLPLVWHISLLTFARRYKTEMEGWQKDDLKLLMRVQTHPKVTPEIRRELFSARCRGEIMDPDPDTIARAIAGAV